MKSIHLFFLLLIASAHATAQDFSNKGKDFWLGYGYHVRYVTTGGGGANGQEMVLYFATENIPGRLTNIKIEIPAVGYVETINNVAPGTIVTSSPLPKAGAQDARLTTEGLFNTGIHVTSDRTVVAYEHIYNSNVSGATLLFPTNTLGREYYSMNYTQTSNEDFSNGFFFVVATDTGTTTVQITPSAQTLSHTAGVPFTVSLTQGQIYNVMGSLNGGGAGNFTGADLTGSRIQSVSVGDVACKRIAVFSGTGKMKLTCDGGGGSADNVIAQAFPKTAWGQRFLTVPTRNMPFNFFRVGVSNPGTVVTVNGVAQAGLINNFYYDLPLTDQPQIIEADQPIMVAQYITTRTTCGNNTLSQDGDPEMIYLSPVEQTIDEVVLNSTPNFQITQHWINVVIKTSGVPSFNINGAVGAVNFLPHPQAPGYSYAQINVSAGSHTLTADSGFNAIAYGYGSAESYGYNAGTNLKDLYNIISPINPLNITGTNSACACTPFFYTITYPYQPLSLFWDFKGFQPNATINNPVHDSTYFINGKQVWRYKLPTQYNYCPAGNYPLTITAGTAGTDGCGNTQVKDDTIFVRNTPTPDFEWIHNGCVTDAVRFNDISAYDDGVFSYQWTWDFGDGSPVSHDQNPVHSYDSPGEYTVTYSFVTNIGCISAVRAKQIIVTDIPVAKFGYSTPLCLNSDVVFTDSSSVSAPGTIKIWHWDFGDGNTLDALTNDNQLHGYGSTGLKTVTLQIETASGCMSLPVSQTFTINPSPVVDFIIPDKVCLPYELANFTDASSIADGSQASFSWKWKFGEPSTGANDSSILKNPSHLYSGNGPFDIKLTVTSAAGCIGEETKTLSNVFAKASASFTVNPENCFNKVTNVASNSSGQGNTITNWNWNFGDGSTGTGNTATHTYAAADTFSIQHWVLTDKGCYSDTLIKNVIINPLPSANFSASTVLCEKNDITITNLSTPGAGNITSWTWNFGIGRPDSVLTNGSPFNYRYDTTGGYTISLSLLTDKGCASPAPFTKTIQVNPLPKPGFISPEVCLTDASAQFFDTSSIASGSITNWQWNFGDPASGINNTFTGLNATHRYNAIGLYTAVLITTSNNGCIDSLRQSFTVNGDVPKANFIRQVSPNLCANDSVIIKDSSTVNFGNVTRVEIYWDIFGNRSAKDVDELPAFNKDYKHLYPDFQSPLTKDFFIRYKAYSGTSCVDSVTKRITVNASPKVQFNTVALVCLDATSYQLTEASEIGGVPGTGVFTGPGISSTGLFTPSVTGVGTFLVLYTYTSTFGCVDTMSNTITVLAPATANFGYSKPACERNGITFTDSSSIPAASGTITNWSWNFGDGTPVVNSNTSAPVSHIYATYNSSYIVTLTITTSNGCKVSKQKTLSVNPLPQPAFRFPASACLPNAAVAFTDASTIADGTENAFTYQWRFDDIASGSSNTSVSKNPTHIYSSDGVYRVTLLCTSGAGCKDSATIPVDIIHPQPTAIFSSDSASICETQSVRFSDNSTGADGTVNKWTWDFGNGNESDIQSPSTQSYNTAKTYTIELQVENTFGCKDTTTKQFVVYASPVISAGRDTVLLEGGEITLNATASGNGLQFLWTPATYLSNNRVIRPVLKGMLDDMTYTLLVVAQGGCWKKDDVFVKLLKAPVIPNTFTPNDDGINDTWKILYLESYPECRIRVFNRDGQAIYESLGYNVTGWDGKYKGKKLPFGTYYYIVEPGSGRTPITGYVTLVY
jgi:gliding motility-associated-like protein